MSSPNKTMNSGANNTFYNLQNKRTLPRQVLKWMQGLDLSYSVKDYRKDMSNGFLIGEIISRYQPGRIPMHAFQNTQNAARRQNNWNQLNLFFRKHNIRDISIGAQQYSSIMKEKDSKSEQLYQLICRLYTICTKRSITENAPIVDVPPTQVNNPNLTASYLLKEEGLQKLDNNSGTLGISRNKTHNIDNSKVDEKSPDRVPTRKIAPNIDANSNMVDVTGIGIKAENRKMTKRKTWQANKEQTNYEDQNQDSQKLIFDYLNQIIEECIPTNDYNLRDLLLPENPKYNLTQSVKKLVPNLDKEFFCNFLHQISVNIDKLIPIMLRQINQIWKFFSYFIKMMRTYSEDSQQFAQLFEIVQNYAINCYIKQSKRLQKVFNQSLIQLLIIEVKTAKQWKKRQALMGLVYDFQGRQLHQKKIVLNKLKQILGSNNSLYIEWLTILIRQQTKNKTNLDNKLIQDFIYYAHQYLSSASQILRTSSLKILQEISKTDSIQLIKEHFISKGKSYQTSQSDPQQVMLLIIIYINLLKNLINSKDYQNLIKGGNTNNLVKAYNPDNEKNMEDLKKKLQLLAETIYKLFSSTSDNVVKEITSKLIVELIPQHQLMMQIFLDFFLIIQEKEEFIQSQQATYQLKSFRITCPKIQASILEDFSNQILIKIINNMLKNDTKIENYLYLINYSLEHINIKKVNMQIWEDIAIHIVKPYTELLANYKHTTLALKGIQIICLIIFNYDMKIRELNGWLAKIFIRITEDNNSGCRPKIIAFNQFLNEQYAKTKHEPIRFMAQELSQILQTKGITNIIVLKE